HVAAEKPETLLHVVDVVGADSKLAVGHLVELSGSDDHKRGENDDLLLRSLKSLAANRNSKFSLTLAARCGQEHADLRSFWGRIDFYPAVRIKYRSCHNRQTETHSSRLGRARRGRDLLIYFRGDCDALGAAVHDTAGGAFP